MIMDDCYQCKYRRDVPGDTHSSCTMPDVEMTGSEHGINNGWFIYPLSFDPIWKTKECSNFKELS